MASSPQSTPSLMVFNDENDEAQRDSASRCISMTSLHEFERQPDSPLMILATKALKEWEKRAAITNAMIWGANLTKSIKSYKEFTALQTSPGLQRLVVVSAGRPQFKLVHRSITVPKRMAAEYKIAAGPLRVRLFIKMKGETWTSTESSDSFTAAWFDIPQRYRIQISKEHEAGQRPGWTFWYKPSQSGRKAKKAAMELEASLDQMVAANLSITANVMGYINKQQR